MLLAAALVLTSSGCFSIMTETRAGTPVVTTTRLWSHPLKQSRMSLVRHGDGLGWTITAEQLIEHHIQEASSQHWLGRRYVFSPLSIFAGIIQCPFGLLSLGNATPDVTSFRHGCARLAMFEPLAGSADLPPTLSSKIRIERKWEPLAAGVLSVEAADLSDPLAHYPLSELGHADIRLSRLIPRLTRSEPAPNREAGQTLLIHLRHDDGPPLIEEVPVLPDELRRARSEALVPIAQERWPATLAIQVEAEEKDARLTHTRLISWLLANNFCAIAGEDLRRHLLDEHHLQHSGGVADAQQVPLGRLHPPSVLITASVVHTGSGSAVLLRIKTLREGELLATVIARARSQSSLPALNLALADLELLMANAPRTGCPKLDRS
jgi:hypothetical protein